MNLIKIYHSSFMYVHPISCLHVRSDLFLLRFSHSTLSSASQHCVCTLYGIHTRPERLIDLIINHDYWEMIDVQTIIAMLISCKNNLTVLIYLSVMTLYVILESSHVSLPHYKVRIFKATVVKPLYTYGYFYSLITSLSLHQMKWF